MFTYYFTAPLFDNIQVSIIHYRYIAVFIHNSIGSIRAFDKALKYYIKFQIGFLQFVDQEFGYGNIQHQGMPNSSNDLIILHNRQTIHYHIIAVYCPYIHFIRQTRFYYPGELGIRGYFHYWPTNGFFQAPSQNIQVGLVNMGNLHLLIDDNITHIGTPDHLIQYSIKLGFVFLILFYQILSFRNVKEQAVNECSYHLLILLYRYSGHNGITTIYT